MPLYKDLPVEHYFRFVNSTLEFLANSQDVFQKLSRQKIRNVSQGSTIIYRKNEEVIDLGETVDIKRYEDVSIDEYFIFVDDPKTVYRKMAKTKIRKLGNELSDTSRYFGNKEVKILGNDMSQFVEPIHVKVGKK
jgi:hypothetical protein